MNYQCSKEASVLGKDFFDRDPCLVAQNLLGKVIRHRLGSTWLAALIIETEAYYLEDKASHASLGYTAKRGALFMPAGTIYMYYARGGDSLNVSCRGAGNAVLLKSGYPYTARPEHTAMLERMQELNPAPSGVTPRPSARLCAGQTLLCRSLGLKVPEWDQKQFRADRLFIDDVGYRPGKLIQTRRLGIPIGRDEHLMHRFIDYAYAPFCTQNILTRRTARKGEDFHLLAPPSRGRTRRTPSSEAQLDA